MLHLWGGLGLNFVKRGNTMLFTQNMKLSEVQSFAEYVTKGGEPLASMLKNLSLNIDLPGVDVTELSISFETNTLKIKEKEMIDATPSALSSSHIVANNIKTKLALGIANRMSKTDNPVLIAGETGTGKDLFARMIHQQSLRGVSPLVSLHGGTVTLESAKQQMVDALVRVGTGTLFIDDIQDLDIEAQRILQRLLHNPVESKYFRLITATSVDLEKEVRQGQFSAELLTLVRGCYIELLPLRQRKEDIAGLLTYYINQLCQSSGQEPKRLSPEVLRMLEIYHWPGNVRELINTVQQLLLAVQEKKTLFAKDLPAHIRIQTLESSALQKKGL